MKVIIALKMTKDIVSKLTVLLDEGIDSECKVLYLLAQIRKLLERDDPTHKLKSLWMYCHWALHVDLDSPKTTGDFLERVNRWITNRVAYLKPVESWTIVDEGNLFRALNENVKDPPYQATFLMTMNSVLEAAIC